MYPRSHSTPERTVIVMRRFIPTLLPLVCATFLLAGCGEATSVEPEAEAELQSVLAAQGVAPTIAGTAGASVAALRRATARYHRIQDALDDGFVNTMECVALPDGSAAMGIHVLHPGRMWDGAFDPDAPEVLLYEPMPNGEMRLVGVEFVVFRSTWGEPPGPMFLGEEFHHSFGEGAHGLPDHYELHIWTWKHNPDGLLADFNPNVTCDYFTAPEPGAS